MRESVRHERIAPHDEERAYYRHYYGDEEARNEGPSHELEFEYLKRHLNAFLSELPVSVRAV